MCGETAQRCLGELIDPVAHFPAVVYKTVYTLGYLQTHHFKQTGNDAKSAQWSTAQNQFNYAPAECPANGCYQTHVP